MKGLWLTFGGQKPNFVEGFSDADYMNQHDHHSISGYSYHFGVGAVSWSLKKQQLVALLTTEAKYIAQVHVAKEALWLCTFIGELCGEMDQPITLHSNNQGAIVLLKDKKFHVRMKHIDV